jgi:hypothetical protein
MKDCILKAPPAGRCIGRLSHRVTPCDDISAQLLLTERRVLWQL